MEDCDTMNEPNDSVPLEQQIRCIEREVAYRERAYSHSVAAGKMTPQKYSEEVGTMRAVLLTLERLR